MSNQAENSQWQRICSTDELIPNIGARALLGNEQVAIFNVNEDYYAISAIDPFTDAAVLARGIVGDLQGKVVVASPIYKQHFELATGQCLEDETVKLKTFEVRVADNFIELGVA